MLALEEIHTYYGESHVLRGVSLEVPKGAVVALLGRNGAGKTTTLRSVMGLTPARRGRVVFEGEDITRRRTQWIARRGLSFLPETRGIFPSLSVEENLAIAAGRRPGPWSLARIHRLFPCLAERRRQGGGVLSGGEQQMLAIARALLLNPELLILDEPTEGLAPVIVREVQRHLQAVKDEGLTILLVEQSFHFATALADTAYVLGKGRVQWQGPSAALVADTEVQKAWLGI
ncbi:MAG: ABC transporter ATP-binding protein [Kiloniellales bacterium]|nr:ABC transporter ATP-binding protein [Kiloniellales bacterium]